MKPSIFGIGKMLTVLFSVALSAALFSNAYAGEPKKAAGKSAKLEQSYIWHDGDREQRVWLNPRLVAEFDPGPEGEKAVKGADSSARVFLTKHPQAGVRLWQVDNTSGAAPRNIKAGNPQGSYSPVLHDGPNSDSRMRALPGNIIVYFDPKWSDTTVSAWLENHRLQPIKKLEIGQNAYVIKTGPGLEALETANALYGSGEVKAAFPDWWQEAATR